MNLHCWTIYYWFLQFPSQLLSRFDHHSRICAERIFKGIYFSQFSHSDWRRIPAGQIRMKLHHRCINTMKIAVTLAKSEKQSFSRHHGPVLAILFDFSKQTSARRVIRKVICSRDLLPVHWGQPCGMACVSQCWWVRDVPVTSPACPSSLGKFHFHNHSSCMGQPTCQACCRCGTEVSLCFMKMLCQLSLVSAEVLWVLYLHGQWSLGTHLSSEVPMGTLLFFIWKLKWRGWIPDHQYGSH